MRLGRKLKKAQRVDLGGGAFVMARAATSIEIEAARAAVARALDDIRQGAELADLYGLDAPAAQSLDDSNFALGLSQLILVTELGLRLIESWYGVEDESGAPAAITRAHVAELLADHEVCDRLKPVFLGPIWAAADEGNASARSPNGASAAGAPIATGAGNPARPAPPAGGAITENSARKSKTRHARRKAVS